MSRSVYDARGVDLVPGVTVLPPGCTRGCAVASDDGTYPRVFNNDLVDGSFGVTSRVFLDQLTTPIRRRPERTRQPPRRLPAGCKEIF